MRRSSLPKPAASPGGRRAWLLASCGAVAIAGAAQAQPGVTPQAQSRSVTVGAPQAAPTNAPQRLNPTGRAVTLTVPAKDGNFYLGDIVVTIDADDHLSFSSQRLLDLLSNVLDPKILETLRGSLAGRQVVSPQDLAGSGITAQYNPQTLDIALGIPSQMRASRSLQVSPLDRAQFGRFERPAHVSAYLNARGSLDYVHTGADKGLGDPTFFLDGAVRVDGFVLESQEIWRPGAPDADFQRQGTRVVFDDAKNVVRWTAGDLQTVGRGFQSAPDMAGVSAFRSYSVLQPQTIARPRGDRSFNLQRSSTVEVYVNGQMVRRVQLEPGNYNLRDFPFTQGANDVRLSITDDTGRTEILRFNIFFDQSQLGKGLSEFGFYAGVKAPLGDNGPHYTNDWEVSGFYRRGVSDNLTLGGNFQADDRSLLVGIEAVVGTVVGTFAGHVAASHVDGFGKGYAATVTYQRLLQRRGGQSDSISLSVETRSRNFGAVGSLHPDNPFAYELGAGYSHTFNDYLYAGLDLHYSRGRDFQPDFHNYRATLGWRLTPTISMTADLLYEKTANRKGLAALVSLTARLGRYSSLRADYDTRDANARVSYQTLHGEGVGSYNISADVERTDEDSGFNFTGNYIANRAELGINHFSSFDGTFGRAVDRRTTIRAASSIAFADGAFSIGRPIYDSFAIIVPHRSLKGASVVVDPSPYGYTASTGALRSAIEPNMAAYSERTITIDAPTAPQGLDLGQGSFRVYPPYRSGYRLQVGSDYSITALGRLLGEDRQPVALVSGTATELAHPERQPVQLFTNRDGRFGLAGLKPGRWRIEMLTDPATVFVVDIPKDTVGIVKLGDVVPTANGR